MKYLIAIPTRDSVRRIVPLVEAYRRMGIEPSFIVDSRSIDGTAALLRELRANVIEFEPFNDTVEGGMIEFAARLGRESGFEWVLRLDDDEFPSKTLLDYAELHCGQRDAMPICCFLRKEAINLDGKIVFARWRSPRTIDGWAGPHAQARLFHIDKVVFTNELHSAGYVVRENEHFAPDEAFFVHLNCIVHSTEARIEKARKYARMNRTLSWKLADATLPELFEATDFEVEEICDADLKALVRDLPIAAQSVPELTRDEHELMRQAAEETRLRRYELGYDNRLVEYFPVNCHYRLAELISTLARLTRSKWLKQHSEAVWKYIRRDSCRRQME